MTHTIYFRKTLLFFVQTLNINYKILIDISFDDVKLNYINTCNCLAYYAHDSSCMDVCVHPCTCMHVREFIINFMNESI